MIVSLDTIKCGRQIVLFFQQESVVVETCEILLFMKKHFETVMLVLPQNIFNFVILQYIQ